MKQQVPDTNTKRLTAFSAGHVLPQKQAEVTVQKCPYLKPEIRITCLQTENGFANGSVTFLNSGGDIQLEDWETETGGSLDIDF